MKTRILLTSLLFASSASLAAPLSRYVPESALAEFQLNGLLNIRPQLNTLFDLNSTFQDAGMTPNEARLAYNLFWGGLGKEASLSVHQVKNDVEVLAVSRLTPTAQKTMQKLFQDEQKKTKKAPVKLREGQYVFYGDSDFYFGFQNGLAYVSSHPQVLRGFLQRLQNSKLTGIAQQKAFVNSMGSVGEGNFRVFLNLKGLTQLVLKEVPRSDLEGLEGIVNLVGTLEGFAMSSKVSKNGDQSNSVLSFQNPSPELASLLSFSKTRFNADALVASDTQGYAISTLNTAGWLDFLMGLVPELSQMERPEVFDRLKAQLGTEVVSIYPAAAAGQGFASLTKMNALIGLEVKDAEASQELLDELLDMAEAEMATEAAGMEEMEGMEDMGMAPRPEFTVERLDDGITCLDFSGGDAASMNSELSAFSSMLGEAVKLCMKFQNNFLVVGFGPEAFKSLPAAGQATAPARYQATALTQPLNGYQWLGPDYWKDTASQLRLSSVMLGSFARDLQEKQAMGFATSLLMGFANLADRTQESTSISFFKNNKLISKTTTRIQW